MASILDHVPRLPRRPWAVLCAVLSLVPGVGTMVAGGYRRDLRQVTYGIVMLLFWWVLFLPWAWSVVWGILMLVRAE